MRLSSTSYTIGTIIAAGLLHQTSATPVELNLLSELRHKRSPASSSAAPTPTGGINTQVGVDPNSKIIVGALTGNDLTTAITNALTTVCPPTGANCGAESAAIQNINFADPNGNNNEGIDTGTITITAVGSYPNSTVANQLIGIIASSMASAATGSNCQTVPWSQGCTAANKRALGGGPDLAPA
ncbi:hypothetical protein G7Y89_g4050 [Cudoniella acicularis]|uniref:Uncharacterized protein n=1 Tax=Cudoniella acicularis TaxID=354080 RepID=A0A8H4W5D2_9HELO|nr:hypothetical protein G7Y89_g4050 [Cudoniella acicularis]